MNAARLSLEGLPLDIATAITRFGLAMNDCGAITVGDEDAFRSTGMRASDARAVLVMAIKRHLAGAPAKLPAADTVTLGAPLETADTDITFSELLGGARASLPARSFLPIGDDFPEREATRELARFVDEHHLGGGAR